MAPPSVSENSDFDSFIRWLTSELARRGIAPENQPALVEFLSRPAADSSIGTLPPHKKQSAAPPPPMTEAEALAIGQNAGNFILTGAGDLAAFDLAKVEQAAAVLHELAYGRFDGTRQAGPLRAIFIAISQINRALNFGPKVIRARGPQKSSLQAAVAILPELAADLEGSGGEYWRNFCREALAEAAAIWAGEG